jgi:hypothetical protein
MRSVIVAGVEYYKVYKTMSNSFYCRPALEFAVAFAVSIGFGKRRSFLSLMPLAFFRRHFFKTDTTKSGARLLRSIEAARLAVGALPLERSPVTNVIAPVLVPVFLDFKVRTIQKIFGEINPSACKPNTNLRLLGVDRHESGCSKSLFAFIKASGNASPGLLVVLSRALGFCCGHKQTQGDGRESGKPCVNFSFVF